MRVRGGAVLKAPGDFEVVDIELAPPRQGELLVKMAASGICHSDDHIATGDMPVVMYPWAGGHEGAGIVAEVGPGTTGFAPGDHVLFSFIPVCGRCRWCATGRQNLCDLGAHNLTGDRPDEPGTYRMHTLDGLPMAQNSGISTFSEYTTCNVWSAIKISPDLPLDKVCLLGCAVGTGWGSAVNAAQAAPGDTIIIMGVGGVGNFAVQGAVHAGARHVVAVDPLPFKREVALRLGATHVYEHIDEAADFARSVTNGQGADAAVVTVGVTTGEHVAQAFAAIRKGGTVVVTGAGKTEEVGVPIKLGELTMWQKRLQGALFGMSNPTWDIPKQLQMYLDGTLKLDEIITRTYRLDDIAQGFADLRAGKNIRGVIVFD